jgi:hypothetical protein
VTKVKDRAQLSFLAGEEYQYFFNITTKELSSEELVDFFRNAVTVRISSGKPSMA